MKSFLVFLNFLILCASYESDSECHITQFVSKLNDIKDTQDANTIIGLGIHYDPDVRDYLNREFNDDNSSVFRYYFELAFKRRICLIYLIFSAAFIAFNLLGLRCFLKEKDVIKKFFSSVKGVYGKFFMITVFILVVFVTFYYCIVALRISHETLSLKDRIARFMYRFLGEIEHVNDSNSQFLTCRNFKTKVRDEIIHLLMRLKSIIENVQENDFHTLLQMINLTCEENNKQSRSNCSAGLKEDWISYVERVKRNATVAIKIAEEWNKTYMDGLAENELAIGNSIKQLPTLYRKIVFLTAVNSNVLLAIYCFVVMLCLVLLPLLVTAVRFIFRKHSALEISKLPLQPFMVFVIGASIATTVVSCIIVIISCSVQSVFVNVFAEDFKNNLIDPIPMIRVVEKGRWNVSLEQMRRCSTQSFFESMTCDNGIETDSARPENVSQNILLKIPDYLQLNSSLVGLPEICKKNRENQFSKNENLLSMDSLQKKSINSIEYIKLLRDAKIQKICEDDPTSKIWTDFHRTHSRINYMLSNQDSKENHRLKCQNLGKLHNLFRNNVNSYVHRLVSLEVPFFVLEFSTYAICIMLMAVITLLDDDREEDEMFSDFVEFYANNPIDRALYWYNM